MASLGFLEGEFAPLGFSSDSFPSDEKKKNVQHTVLVYFLTILQVRDQGIIRTGFSRDPSPWFQSAPFSLCPYMAFSLCLHILGDFFSYMHPSLIRLVPCPYHLI